MPLLVSPRKWKTQPPYFAGIDAGNPITAGLSAVFDGVSKRFGNTQATGDTSIRRVGSSGVGITTNYIGSNFLEFPHRPQFVVTGGISLGVVFDVDTIGQYGGLIAKQATATTHCPYELRIGSGINDSNFEFLRANGSGYKSFAGTGNRLSSGQKYIRLMITAPSGISNQPTGYLNGSSFTMATASGAGSGDATDNGASSVRLGTRADGVTFLDGGIYFVGIWNRELSAPEALEWTLNPWQVYRKSPITYFIPSAGGGGATDIAGELESLTLSTFGATVGSARDIAGALESLSLTPYAALVSRASALTAAVESISLGTYAATVANNATIAAGLESIALTTSAASVTLGAAIAAAMEAIVLAANPAAVRLDAAVAAQLEQITITGLGASIATGSNIGAQVESITLSVPQALVSSDRTIAGGLESITVTANGATVTLGALIGAAMENIALTSYGAGITLNVTLAGGLEQINLTTLAAQIGLGSNVAALVEAITLTEFGATLTMTGEITAALESIGLTTFIASIMGGESALTTPGLEFTIPLGRMHYSIPVGRIHFTIPRD